MNPDAHLVVDWIQVNKAAGLTQASPGDNVASVNGRSFYKVNDLYAYLSTIPDGAKVDFILYGYSGVSEFFREHRHVELRKSDLMLITVQD